MAGGLSGRGERSGGHSHGRGGYEGRSLVRGSEGGSGERTVGVDPRGGCGRGNGRGGRPLDLSLGDGFGRGDGQIGTPTRHGFGEGHGRGNGHGSLPTAAPPALPRASTTTVPSPMALADDEPPASPAISAAGTNHGDQLETSSDNASSSNSKPLLKIAHKIFTPSHVASGQITKCIKQRFDKEGYTWSAVSSQTKDYYWNEFQKYFSFDRDLSMVRNIFESRAGVRYSGLLCEWRKSGQRPVSVPQGTWDSWQQKRDTPEFKKKCSQASQNHLSGIVGRGDGPSRHCGGSRSALDHSIFLAKELGRVVTDYDIFVRMHKKADGKFVDKRSENVNEEVMPRFNAATQNQTDNGDNSSRTVDLSSIYYEVAGPMKKQWVYGLGSKPSAAIPNCSSSEAPPLDSDQLCAQLYEELREEMRQR